MPLIACRLASYGKFQDRAWTHLPQIGIRNVEFEIPADGNMEPWARRLSEHGMTATSLHAICDIKGDDAVQVMARQLAICGQMQVRYCFVSMHAGEADRAAIWDRLRRIGDETREQDVTVVLETHPDLVTNAAVARQTMEAIDHPNLRINFDTANVYFYNHDVTAHGELAQIIDYVAAVHLKDSTGEYKAFDFPPLGQGIVDFPKIFAMLGERHFVGPCTMELEGSTGVELDEADQLKYVADSAAYLRGIGALA